MFYHLASDVSEDPANTELEDNSTIDISFFH